MYFATCIRRPLMWCSIIALFCSCASAPDKSTEAKPGVVNLEVSEQNIPPAPSPSLPSSVLIPSDGSAPQSSVDKAKKPTTTLTFTRVGQREFVRTGESINLLYDGIEASSTYLKYESAEEGYYLEVAKVKEPTYIQFNYLCQRFIVANPTLASVAYSQDLRYEQIVWTPRSDGSWEVRIGATERGCKSEALDAINKLRGKEYEKTVPKKNNPKK